MNNENDRDEPHDSEEVTENSKIDPNELMLSYLTCPQDAANSFLGALMITDYRARPLHFAFVSPIRPTKIQKILYGSTLEEHIKIDVIGEKLLKDLPYPPDVLFVDTKELLIIRRLTEIPTAFLSKNIETEDDPGRLSALEYDTGSNQDDQDIVGRVLGYLYTQIDLIEPFVRMREALKEAIKKPDA